jgi:formamidopyrimidine-DNA glycosylase
VPELPEVETIRRVLSEKLPGRRILNLQTHHAKPLRPQSMAEFEKQARGQRIVAVERRAKYLFLRLEHGSLLVHLGMTGQLFAAPVVLRPAAGKLSLPDQHTHVILFLSGGMILYFRDIRRFGKIRWVTDEQMGELLQRLGPEPLSSKFTVEGFRQALTRRRTSIKALLLNQAVVAGIGNIYADESLFRAGVAPQTRGATLTLAQISRLHTSIRRVLREAIRHRGTTLSDYFDPESRKGGFQARLKVYGREGEPCQVCRTLVRKDVTAQRGTHWCPACQPGPKNKTGPRLLNKSRNNPA